MRKSSLVMIFVILVSCAPRVSGEIGKACISGGRDAANASLCSCIQQVANQTLSTADQTRAVPFFSNPQLAQDTRQADGSRSEAFWDRYTAFAEQARCSCN